MAHPVESADYRKKDFIFQQKRQKFSTFLFFSRSSKTVMNANNIYIFGKNLKSLILKINQDFFLLKNYNSSRKLKKQHKFTTTI